MMYNAAAVFRGINYSVWEPAGIFYTGLLRQSVSALNSLLSTMRESL